MLRLTEPALFPTDQNFTCPRSLLRPHGHGRPSSPPLDGRKVQSVRTYRHTNHNRHALLRYELDPTKIWKFQNDWMPIKNSAFQKLLLDLQQPRTNLWSKDLPPNRHAYMAKLIPLTWATQWVKFQSAMYHKLSNFSILIQPCHKAEQKWLSTFVAQMGIPWIFQKNGPFCLVPHKDVQYTSAENFYWHTGRMFKVTLINFKIIINKIGCR